MWWRQHLEYPATCPPSASVLQASMADITLSWVRLTWPAWVYCHGGPWARLSANSSWGRVTRCEAGEVAQIDL